MWIDVFELSLWIDVGEAALDLLELGVESGVERVVEAGEQIVMVPRDAIITFAGIDKVLTVEEGQAVEKRVRTGRRIGEQIEIVEGVAAGFQVIVDPGNLVAGQPVSVVN